VNIEPGIGALEEEGAACQSNGATRSHSSDGGCEGANALVAARRPTAVTVTHEKTVA
jgi:hypothetical protein